MVDVWLLIFVDPWWWGLLAGIVLTGAATAAAIRLRFRTRRRETAAALAAGLVLLTGSAVMLAVDTADRAAQSQHELDQAHDEAVARILPHTPAGMVAFLVERIARPTPDAVADACFVFNPTAGRQLADARHVPDCPAAIRALAAQVADPADYINNLWLPGSATSPGPSGTLVVDACHLDFSSVVDDTPHPHPGPQIGILTLAQQHGAGHLIIDYRACPAS